MRKVLELNKKRKKLTKALIKLDEKLGKIYIPYWIASFYSELYDKFKGREFLFEDARKILKKTTSVVLSEFYRYGLIKIKENGKDRRKKIYQLK